MHLKNWLSIIYNHFKYNYIINYKKRMIKMRKLIKFMKKGMLIALLYLVINTSITAIPGTSLTVTPIPDPCSTCGNPTPTPSTENPMEDHDYS